MMAKKPPTGQTPDSSDAGVSRPHPHRAARRPQPAAASLEHQLRSSRQRVTALGNELETAQRQTTRLEKDRRFFDEELELARVVQKNFLPRTRQFPGFETFCHLTSSRVIGGDFYDLVPLQDGALACIVADVAGKGIAAALLMALSIAILRESIRAQQSPAAILHLANALLRENTPEEYRFVSASATVLDPHRRTLTYASAGHEFGLFLPRRTQRCHLLGSTGLLLGVENNADYAETTRPLHHGDRLILCTDGITEAFDPHRACYGVERLVDVVHQYGSRPLDTLGMHILDDVEHFRDGTAVNDDVTLMLVEFTPLR